MTCKICYMTLATEDPGNVQKKAYIGCVTQQTFCKGKEGTAALIWWMIFCSSVRLLGTGGDISRGRRKGKKEAVKCVSGAPWNTKLMVNGPDL